MSTVNGGFMKRFLVSLPLVLALLLPALAQRGRLSPDDQRKFDSYYSRWISYRQTNNRDQMVSMERRMQDLMSHSGIPTNTPYDRVASNGGGGDRDRDNRDWNHDQDRDRDRDHDRDHDGEHWRDQGRSRLSGDDQSHFDSYYSRWIEYRRTNNRDQAASMEKRMRDVMARNGIPQDVPFDRVASQGQRY
jgi:hypothetical protein